MIGKVIYAKLRYDADVYNIVNNRIYPVFADLKADVPYVTYDIISNIPTQVKGEVAAVDSIRVQVNCIAATYDAAATLADKVRTALEGYSGLYASGYPYVITTLFDGDNDLPEEEDVTGRALDFIIKVRKTTG